MWTRCFKRTLVTGVAVGAFSTSAFAACVNPDYLSFRADGTFRILQINDTQDDQFIDFRTPALIKTAIEQEDPDLVVCAGDCISGGAIRSDEDARTAIDNVFQVIEDAGVPFIVAFGNHDADSFYSGNAPNMDEDGQLEYYRNAYTCNVNQPDDPDVTGTGDMMTLVYGSSDNGQRRDDPKLAVWAIDSGRYAPNPIADQRINYNDNTWDWIRQDQVEWYRDTSEKLQKKYRGKVPGIMFFHIPLFEFETMWSVDKGLFPSNDVPNLDPTPVAGSVFRPKEAGRHSVEEERNECVCTGPFDSGLFAAALERGDIMGMFVGHDHINSYVGNFHGILLGYGASAGFGPYGFGGQERNRLRGIRIHDFNEDDVEGYVSNIQTDFKRAGADYGMCLAPNEADCHGDPFYAWAPPAVTAFKAVNMAGPEAGAEGCPAPEPGVAYKTREGERCPVATDEIVE
jgi:hypothetical protein